jgi:hypothetical protein
MKPRVVRHEHARELLADAEGFLAAREVEHTIPFGVACEIVSGARPCPPRAYFAAVHEGRRVAAVAIHTPPYNLVVACDGAEAAAAIARDVRETSRDLPGVVGPRDSASLFAHAWAKISGCVVSPRMAQWIYAIDERARASPARGVLRPAGDDDLPVVRAWVGGFSRDVFGATLAAGRSSEAEALEVERVAKRRLGDRRLYLWEDGAPVSMAGWGARTPRTARISMVYTPPDRRGRGYANACVSALARVLFDEGCETCCLVADQANPISNRLYARIGFERVCEQHEWRFG